MRSKVATLILLLLLTSTLQALEIIGPDIVDGDKIACYEAEKVDNAVYLWTVHPIGTADVKTFDNTVIFNGPRDQAYTIQLVRILPKSASEVQAEQEFKQVWYGSK